MTLKGKNVLVTGGTGFIGGRLVEKLFLEQKANVRVLVRNFGNAVRVARFPIELIPGDIIDRPSVQKAMQGCDIVFHCAHATGPSKKQTDTAIAGVQNIADTALQEGISRIVHISSYAVYGHGTRLNGDMTESTKWINAKHPYIIAKRKTESLIKEYSKSKNLPAVILQPTIVYGPFAKAWTLLPVDQLKTGVVPLVNGGKGLCNAVYIDDVVDAMLLAAVKPDVIGETFLISSEIPITFKTFFEAFGNVIGTNSMQEISSKELVKLSKKKKLHGHPAVIPFRRIIARIAKEFMPGDKWQATWYPKQTSQSLHIPSLTQIELFESETGVNISKAKKLLDYNPKFSFDHGMEMTAKFLRWAGLCNGD